MSGLMGGGSSSQNATAIGTLNLQTSCYGNPIPWAFGTVRVAPNLIQYEDFTSIPHQQSGGGKGGHASGGTTYTYTAAVIMALTHGPIVGVPKAWKDKDVSTLGDLVLDLYTGSSAQNPYPYMQTKHPDRALGYRGISYVAGGAYDLGNNAQLGNHSFEVQTSARIGGLPDANVADVIKSILTDPEQGLGLPASSVGDLTQFSNFCLANGIWVSPLYKEQKPAFENIKNLLQIGFADCYRSSGVLNVVPYADFPATSTYGNFVPALPAPLVIGEDDILDVGDDPLLMTQKSLSESFNHVQVKFSDRSNDYNDNIAEAKDFADIEQFGIRSMPVVDMKEICDPATATKVADFLLHRSLYIRNEYEFSLPWKYCYLEPMDLLAITYPRKGHDGTVVMITEITEDEDGMLTVKAEEYPLGTNSHAIKTPPTTDGYTPDFSVDPGGASDPVIFEPPLQLTNNNSQIWIAASGGANWGGADVWVSTDNATYKKVGRIQQKSRYGYTSSAIDAVPGVDSVSNLGVNLGGSSGVLLSGTQQDAQNLVTGCYVGGEYLSYATAQLTSANNYNLSYLVRGCYGTSSLAHSAGVPFVRLDDAIFSYDYPAEWVGKTIYIKLASFNSFGSAVQDISQVEAYSHTLSGGPVALATVLKAVPKVFSIELDWSMPPTVDYLQSTEVWYSLTPDRGSAKLLTTVAAPQASFVMSGLGAGVEFYFWIRFVDKKGNIGDFFPSGAGVDGQSSSDATQILEYLKDGITKSQLAKDLLSQIQLISDLEVAIAAMPPGSTLQQMVAQQQNQIAASEALAAYQLMSFASADQALTTAKTQLKSKIANAQAQLDVIQQTVATENSAMSQQITQLQAVVGDNHSAILSEQQARATADQSLALQITQMSTVVGQNTSAIQTEQQARSDAVQSLATQISQVQATAGDASAAVQNISSAVANINGQLSATETIKTQITEGGKTYIAGIGLMVDNSGGTPESEILLSAQKIAFVDESTGNVTVPFVVVGGQTFISQAFIGTANVDTLQIAGNAVTVPLSATMNTTIVGNSSWQNILSITMPASGQGQKFLGIFSARASYTNNGDVYFQVLKNGNVFQTYGHTFGGDDWPSFHFPDALGVGESATYTVQFLGGSFISIFFASMFCMGIKR